MFDWRGYAKMKLILGLVILCVYGLIYLWLAPQHAEFEQRVAEDWETRTVREYDPNEMKEYIADTFPKGWEHAYFLTDIPEGFEYSTSHTELLKGPFLFPEQSYVIHFTFTKYGEDVLKQEQRFYFHQAKSAEFDETMGLLEQIEHPKENTYYYGTSDDKNVVFWFDGAYTLYLQDEIGTMSFGELEEVAEFVEPYPYVVPSDETAL